MPAKGQQTSRFRGKPCKGCGQTMRLSRDKAAENPNTVIHWAGGRCKPCDRLYLKQGKPAPAPPEPRKPRRRGPAPKPVTIYGLDDPDPNIRAAARGALRFHRARAARGADPAGLTELEMST